MKDTQEVQDKIPVSKVARATAFLKTGVKVGANYVKHYAKKLVTEVNQEELDEKNAADIYETLSQLKGSALKIAQMMSMDEQNLPKAYTRIFAQAQYKAPPLSGPLIIKTFKDAFGKTPQEIFDTFDMSASHAASIGQVHKATKNGQHFAIKIQYPGVKEAISSDLKMVKPFAMRLMKMKEKEINTYLQEIEQKLIEETDYLLELKQAQEISSLCRDIPNVSFPKYYPEYSATKVLTMEWIFGKHLDQFLAENPSQERKNKIAQAIWDFYNYQIHYLKKVHSDPHPGNFLISEQDILYVLDFGCVKQIPKEFYEEYFKLTHPDVLSSDEKTELSLRKLEIIRDSDSQEQVKYFVKLFQGMLKILAQPYYQDSFDFGNPKYYSDAQKYADELSKMREARGSKHFLYVNRTYFGIYSMMQQLQAHINTGKEWNLNKFVVLE
ncbi:MAG: AarF/ABC1/UbiB kinase family protein [Bacteroidia bacterium]|nr:AarF/ABC1/UbiB kinase family protein [Bacteroidia bacterium]MDW8301257.1 AarF/ABC1/UbiB kinase family protein [Bacteroidia bacterium]